MWGFHSKRQGNQFNQFKSYIREPLNSKPLPTQRNRIKESPRLGATCTNVDVGLVILCLRAALRWWYVVMAGHDWTSMTSSFWVSISGNLCLFDPFWSSTFRGQEKVSKFWTHHRHEETHPSAEWKPPWDLTLQWNIHQQHGWNTEPTLATPRRRRGGVFGAPEVFDVSLGSISVAWGSIPLSIVFFVWQSSIYKADPTTFFRPDKVMCLKSSPISFLQVDI